MCQNGLLLFYIHFKARDLFVARSNTSAASELNMWAKKNITKANLQRWSCSLTSTNDYTLTVDTHTGASRHIPTLTHSYKHSKHTYSSRKCHQPLFCLVPFIETVWWRGPKFNHAFSLDWSPPYLESLFVAVSLHSCLCHALRRERGGLINLPVCLAWLPNCSRTGTHRLQCTTVHEHTDKLE